MNSFKVFRLHLFCFEANAYLETVAKLVLPTERYHWLFEVRLRHV